MLVHTHWKINKMNDRNTSLGVMRKVEDIEIWKFIKLKI